MATSGVTGAFAIAPLRRDDGSRVLVNRGWLPREEVQRRIAAAKTGTSAPSGATVSITGVLEEGDTGSMFSPANSPTDKNFFWVELPVLAQATGFDAVGNLPPLLGQIGYAAEVPLEIEDEGGSTDVSGSWFGSSSGADAKKTKDPAPAANAEEMTPQPKQLHNFKSFHVTPMTHATYAFTW
jgi:cytochrome oxidase assembly protein ShyY1